MLLPQLRFAKTEGISSTASLPSSNSSQKVGFTDLDLFKNVREQIRAYVLGRMDRNRSPATISVVEYGVATFLPHLLESECS